MDTENHVDITYLLTPWSRVLLEKLTSKLCSYSRNSPHLWNLKVPHCTHKWPPSIPILSQLHPVPKTPSAIYPYFFCGCVILPLETPPSWRTTPRRLSAAAYLIYLQLPSILEAVPPSATRGRAMPWWQGRTFMAYGYYTKYFFYISCVPLIRTFVCSD